MKKLIFFSFVCLCFIGITSCSDEEVTFANVAYVNPILIEGSSDIEKEDTVNIDLPLPYFNSPEVYEIIENCEVLDTINERTWLFNVLLPPSYLEEEKTFPVLYLLHGYDCDRTIWQSKLSLYDMMNYCHYNKSLPEMIIVMPDAENTYYLNNEKGIFYENYFINILIPKINSDFKVKSEKSFSFIAGFSMGGYGAAYYSLKYPEVFGFCYSMSAPLDGRGKALTVPSLFNYFVEIDKDKFPYLIFDIGFDDDFVSANSEANELLNLLSLPHEFILREGKHKARFWKESLYLMLGRIKTYMHIYEN